MKVSKRFIQILNLTYKLRLKEMNFNNKILINPIKKYEDLTDEIYELFNERNLLRYKLYIEYNQYKEFENLEWNLHKSQSII
jgi:hypothetical protein